MGMSVVTAMLLHERCHDVWKSFAVGFRDKVDLWYGSARALKLSRYGHDDEAGTSEAAL